MVPPYSQFHNIHICEFTCYDLFTKFWVYFHLSNLLIGIGQQRHSKHRRHDAKRSRLPGGRASGREGRKKLSSSTSLPNPPAPALLFPLPANCVQEIHPRKNENCPLLQQRARGERVAEVHSGGAAIIVPLATRDGAGSPIKQCWQQCRSSKIRKDGKYNISYR